ncbi:MAG: ribonuclease D [Blastocatellia bacterium]|nr:ribonuclease D [Blastocatellia bacterium]
MADSYLYLIDPQHVREALSAFAGQPIIGLDTETFFYRGKNHLSLLQLAAPGGAVVVIDALSAGIQEVQRLIEDPGILMAAHNARFDETVLRQAGFDVAGLVDTLRLARCALPLRSFGLAAVAEHLLGLTLDKSYQQSDWRRRPLSREQLDYAALDAQVALLVYQELTLRLESEGRLADELSRALILPRVGTVSSGNGNDKKEEGEAKSPPSVMDNVRAL